MNAIELPSGDSLGIQFDRRSLVSCTGFAPPGPRRKTCARPPLMSCDTVHGEVVTGLASWHSSTFSAPTSRGSVLAVRLKYCSLPSSRKQTAFPAAVKLGESRREVDR